MPSCMSKDRFVRIRILILTSKIIDRTWRPLEINPGGQLPGGQILFFMRDLKSTPQQTLIKTCMKEYDIRVCPLSCICILLATRIGSTSSGLQVQSNIFDARIKILALAILQKVPYLMYLTQNLTHKKWLHTTYMKVVFWCAYWLFFGL